MATESRVTTEGSHPFSTGLDLCLVHNGSLSNHNRLRRALRREGIEFQTENDTEVAAGYLAWRMREGASLEQALEGCLDDLDGFYTFLVGTADGFAVLRDPIACKPAVLAETDDWVAMASEYRAIAVLPGAEEARMWEPEPGVVYAWERAARRMTRAGRRPRSSTSPSTPLRELNQRLHDVAPDRRRGRAAGGSSTRSGAHAVACGLDAELEVEIEGHVGYYCAGMNKLATVRVRGNAGTGIAENMMSGRVVVEGNASQSAGATGHGGLLVVHGDASARCGISMKGVDIVVRGSVGHLSAFMAQTGRLVVCGDAGEALGDSIYEARLYVRGEVAGLGADCVEKEMRDEHVVEVRDLLARAGIDDVDPATFRRYGSARQALQLHGRQRGGVLMSTAGSRACASRPSTTATSSPRSSAPRARGSTTSAASARSGGCRTSTTCSFLGASISRYPLEGYRERCDTNVTLGTRFAKKPLELKIPITIAGMSFGALSAPAKEALGRGATEVGHLDDDRRRRHDAGGARALGDRSSTSCCRRATG